MLKTKNHFRNTYEVVENTIFRKRAYLPVKKRYWINFSHTMEIDRPPGTIYKSLRGFFSLFVQV